MAVITPTITTNDVNVYRAQMDAISGFADGVHVDFADGNFTKTTLLPIKEAWRSEDLITHIHVMYRNPLREVKRIARFEADLVILHQESENLKKCLIKLHKEGVRTGIALLPETPVLALREFEGYFDHVLVFGGRLGYQGGEADLNQLGKVKEIKASFPDVEISWDGGVNDKNAEKIMKAGVSILNVGSFIKNAQDPKKAYDLLTSLVS